MHDKAFSFLEKVVGLDTSKYIVAYSSYSDFDKYQNVSSSKSSLGELVGRLSDYDSLSYTLKLDDRTTEFNFMFLNGTFLSCSISQINGSLASGAYVDRLPTDSLEATKEILQRLRVHFDATYIQSMIDSLNSVKDKTSVNATIDSVKRQVITYPDGESYTFSYVLNDAAASPKSVVISFFNGELKGISIPWSSYEIAEDKIIISREQAIEIAKENAQNASTEPLKYRSDPIKAELTYITTDENPYLAYPLWYVELPLDYPGSTVTGWQAGIWAHTGKIAYGHPAGVLGTIDTNNQQQQNPSPTPTPLNQNNDNWQLTIYTTIIAVAILSTTLLLIIKYRIKK
ncbi:MAG: hypothetical protein ACFCUE_03125 [Candidatus Bathyarchaeia archaeon]